MSEASNATAKRLRENKDSPEYEQYRLANNQAAAAWRARNPEAAARMHQKRKFGLDDGDYVRLLQRQNGVCAICHGQETAKTRTGGLKPLAVDHCHATGVIRGLLCHACNQILGFARDNTRTLQTAISYLEMADTGFRQPTALDSLAADRFLDELKDL